MADRTEPPSTYSEASFVTTKNDLKHKFYRPDVSEMLAPVVNQSEVSTVWKRCLMCIADESTPRQLQSCPNRRTTCTHRGDRKSSTSSVVSCCSIPQPKQILTIHSGREPGASERTLALAWAYTLSLSSDDFLLILR